MTYIRKREIMDSTTYVLPSPQSSRPLPVDPQQRPSPHSLRPSSPAQPAPGPSLPSISRSPSPPHPGGGSDDDNNNTPSRSPSAAPRAAPMKEPAAPLKKSRAPPPKQRQRKKKTKEPKVTLGRNPTRGQMEEGAKKRIPLLSNYERALVKADEKNKRKGKVAAMPLDQQAEVSKFMQETGLGLDECLWQVETPTAPPPEPRWPYELGKPLEKPSLAYLHIGFMDPSVVNQQQIQLAPEKTLVEVYNFLDKQTFKDFILIPYNFNFHWILIIIEPERSHVTVFDSLRKDPVEYQDMQDMLGLTYKGPFKEKLTWNTDFPEPRNNPCDYYIYEHMHSFMGPKGLKMTLHNFKMLNIQQGLLKEERVVAICEGLVGFLTDEVVNPKVEFYYDGQLDTPISNTSTRRFKSEIRVSSHSMTN
uniref:Ubiquitin-like protease family profile domain-containing protein n=1 Tax=Setaria viridis TaxID=4556 RepID=A0A4U6U1U1_SETVI|nr:hypothetical protein SEVIR_6G095400v2 [Setaria viridis]